MATSTSSFATSVAALCLVVATVVVHAQSTSSVVRAAIIGDFGISNPLSPNSSQTAEGAVADMIINEWQPDFILTLGDNNYMEGENETIDANIGKFYSTFIYPYRGQYPSGASKTNRFFPSIGNHDTYTTNLAFNGVVQPAAPYLRYFSDALQSSTSATLSNSRYYTFTRGSVQFFALNANSYEPDGNTWNSTQAQWLQQGLANSRSPFRVVYFHQPPVSADTVDGPTSAMRWPFREFGATVLLCGHAHTYQKYDWDGIPLLVNGLGGADIYTEVDHPNPEPIVWFNSTWGAQLLEADDTTMNITFRSIDGSFVDVVSFVAPSSSPQATTAPPQTTAAPQITTAAPPNGASSQNGASQSGLVGGLAAACALLALLAAFLAVRQWRMTGNTSRAPPDHYGELMSVA